MRGSKTHLHIDGDWVVDEASGAALDVRAAIKQIPWTTATKYPPPHQYVLQARCPVDPWRALAFYVRHHPDSYLAYFRGYRTPNRYLDLDGRRYWMTSAGGAGGRVLMLNRALFEDAEPPRRLDRGGVPILDWEGPPWGLNGSPWPDWYQKGPDGQYHYQRRLDPYRPGFRKPEQ